MAIQTFEVYFCRSQIDLCKARKDILQKPLPGGS